MARAAGLRSGGHRRPHSGRRTTLRRAAEAALEKLRKAREKVAAIQRSLLAARNMVAVKKQNFDDKRQILQDEFPDESMDGDESNDCDEDDDDDDDES